MSDITTTPTHNGPYLIRNNAPSSARYGSLVAARMGPTIPSIASRFEQQLTVNKDDPNTFSNLEARLRDGDCSLVWVDERPWVRGDVEIDPDDAIEMLARSPSRPLDPAERKHFSLAHEAERTRRAFFAEEFRNFDSADARTAVALAIDDLEDCYEHLVDLRVEADARINHALVVLEDAVNRCNQAAPRGYKQLYAGGHSLPRTWAEAFVAGPIFLDHMLKERVGARVRQLAEQRRKRTDRVGSKAPVKGHGLAAPKHGLSTPRQS
jgi:hypothetical protein